MQLHGLKHAKRHMQTHTHTRLTHFPPPFETGHTQSAYTLQRQCFVTKGFVRSVFLHHKQFRGNNSDTFFSLLAQIPAYMLPGLFLIVIIPWKVPRVIFVCLCFSCDIKGINHTHTQKRQKDLFLPCIAAYYSKFYLSSSSSSSLSHSLALSLPPSLSLSLVSLSCSLHGPYQPH